MSIVSIIALVDSHARAHNSGLALRQPNNSSRPELQNPLTFGCLPDTLVGVRVS